MVDTGCLVVVSLPWAFFWGFRFFLVNFSVCWGYWTACGGFAFCDSSDSSDLKKISPDNFLVVVSLPWAFF